jgi:rhodanese-related sulfurtransferase
MRKTALYTFLMIFMLNVSAFALMNNDYKDQPLTKALHKTGIKIIDIRTEPEWKSWGIVKGSHTLTFFDERGRYDANSFLRDLNKIVKPDERFAIICRSGNRTTTVAKFLRKVGYRKVINLKGGIKKAIQNGVEIEKYK